MTAASSNSLVIPNVERLYPNRRYVPMLVYTKKCPLTFHQRLIYSYLIFRMRKEQSATKGKIASLLRMDKSTVRSALTELANADGGSLLAVDGRYFKAKEPSPSQKGWFGYNKRSDVAWHRQFATYPLLLPVHGASIPPKTNGLLWLLYSLAPQFGRPVVMNQKHQGLAVMLNISPRAVRSGLSWLEEKKLLKATGTTVVLLEPPSELLDTWRGRRPKVEKRFRVSEILGLKTRSEDPRKQEDMETIKQKIDEHGETMRRAGCSERDVVKFWDVVTDCYSRDLDELWMYVVVYFAELFETLAEKHRASGYPGSCMKLLWTQLRQKFPDLKVEF